MPCCWLFPGPAYHNSWVWQPNHENLRRLLLQNTFPIVLLERGDDYLFRYSSHWIKIHNLPDGTLYFSVFWSTLLMLAADVEVVCAIGPLSLELNEDCTSSDDLGKNPEQSTAV